MNKQLTRKIFRRILKLQKERVKVYNSKSPYKEDSIELLNKIIQDWYVLLDYFAENEFPSLDIFSTNKVRYNYPFYFDMSFNTNVDGKSLKDLRIEHDNKLSTIVGLKPVYTYINNKFTEVVPYEPIYKGADTECIYTEVSDFDNAMDVINFIKSKGYNGVFHNHSYNMDAVNKAFKKAERHHKSKIYIGTIYGKIVVASNKSQVCRDKFGKRALRFIEKPRVFKSLLEDYNIFK